MTLWGLLLVGSLLCVNRTQAQDDDDMDMGGMGGMDDDEDYGGMGGMGDEDDEMGEGGGGGDFGESPQGAVKLDNLTFDKVIRIPDFTTLVKFDSSSAYDEAETFKTLCPLAYSVAKFLIGEVTISDDTNEDLKTRFKLKSEDFPAYFLFKGSPKLEDSIRYTGSKTTADITSWLRRQGVKISSVGTIAEFDEIAARFAAGKHTEADVTKAQALAEGDDYKGDRKAAVYVKVMKQIMNKGSSYAKTETARLEKVMAGSLSEEKRAELSEKMRILAMFAPEAHAKDEL